MSSRGSDSLYLSLHFHFSALVMKPLLSSDISIMILKTHSLVFLKT